MATGPLSEDQPGGPVDGDGDGDGDLASWRARALEAEELARELADELQAAREQLAADPTRLTLFDDLHDGADDADRPVEPGRAPDGSEPGVLPVTLAALATVAGLSAALSWVNTGLGSAFTLVMVAAAAGLGWAAWSTRVVATEVTVADGIVTISRGDERHRFDLRSESTRIEVIGTLGATDWRVRFYRRALDPVDVDARMVDPEAFLTRLREFRPDV